MTPNFKMTKENIFNLRLLVKRCGLKYKDIGVLINESKQSVLNDFKGKKISEYRLICYGLLFKFLTDTLDKGEIFCTNEKETVGAASARRKKFALLMRDKFLDKLSKRS